MEQSDQSQETHIIRPLRLEDIPRLEGIAAAAWLPIYRHFAHLQEQALGEVARPYRLEGKREQVRRFCEEHPDQVLVSEWCGRVAGFITFTFDEANAIGVIGNNAVHPDYTGRGIGTGQYRRAIEVFRQRGMRYAAVTTGLDESHAPARRAYEKVGFVPVLSSVEYMMKL